MGVEDPERSVTSRYFLSARAAALTGEYPYLYHAMGFEPSGYDGVIEPGMTIIVHRRDMAYATMNV